MDTVSGVNETKPILLFDGVCNLCSGFVQFVIPRDPQARIRFGSLQSEPGKELLRQYGLPTDEINSLVVVDQGRVYRKSSGALRLTRYLKGLWPCLYAFIVVPRPFRDFIYDWVARNRYRWFGKQESCMIPSPELKARFLKEHKSS